VGQARRRELGQAGFGRGPRSGARGPNKRRNHFNLFSEEQQHFHIFEQQKSIFTSWSKNKSCLEF
jgi:hypothetical protein